MGEMEQAFTEAVDKGHKAVITAVRDLEKLGYRIHRVQYQSGGYLDIGCYCPQDNEGSKEPFNWVGLSDSNNPDMPGKVQ